MNEPECNKPKECEEIGCKNKVYKKDQLSPVNYIWVCRKHYYEYCYGIVGNYWNRSK